MKKFLGFVRKEFLHIFRDTRTMLILFVIPIAQILIFGLVVTNEVKDVDIAILDHSKDEITARITHKIRSSGFFRINKELSSSAEIENAFRQGKIKEVIVFESDFGQKLQKTGNASIQLIADASDANSANMIVNYSSRIIMDYMAELNRGKNIPFRVDTEVRMLYNENLLGVYMFVPGTMALILILISAMMTSISIAREKELGTLEALLVSPLKPAQIIIGKVTPYVLLSFVNAITIIVLGYFVFGLPFHGNIFLLMGMSLLFISLSLAIGIFISTVSKTQQSAMFISLFTLMLPTILLSGFIFPVENMPEILQWLSCIVPPRWFIVILKNIMLKGTGFMAIWKETLILCGMLFFFLLLAVKKFKTRLE